MARNLSKNMVGEDVRYVKDALHSLGYLKVKPTHNYFYTDTANAVKAFQKANKDALGKPLDVDGIVGPLTYAAIVRALAQQAGDSNILVPSKYPHINSGTLAKINVDLRKVSKARQEFVAEAMKYAYDQAGPNKLMRGMYVYGANLYDTKLYLQIADEAFIRAKAARNLQVFTNGRLEFMIKESKTRKIPCSDCSGMIVGIMRYLKYVKPTFDVTADALAGNGQSTARSKADLAPGDWVHLSGHIGIYVGAGYVVEFAGGAYGCQLTALNQRVVYDFMSGKHYVLAPWTKYRKPKIFAD